MNTVETEVEDRPEPQDNGLLSRWAKRKQAVLQETKDLQESRALANQERSAELHLVEEAALEEAGLPTDSDMPPIESLSADSDYCGFMSPKVSEPLRRLALRKLFHGAGFNTCDGLDDYDEDYTSFVELGNVITADIKHRIEMEARKKLEVAVASSESEDEVSESIVAESIVEESIVEESIVEETLAKESIVEETLCVGDDEPIGEPDGGVFG